MVKTKKINPESIVLNLKEGNKIQDQEKGTAQEPRSPKTRRKILPDLVAVFILIALAVLILIPSLAKKDEIAPGADVGSHVYIAKYLTDFVKENKAMPAVNPYWYAGWEPYHNVPKIMPILIGAAYYLSNNIIRVSQITQATVIIFAALAMYLVVRKKYSSLSALFGSLLFAFGPAFLFDIVYLGSFPRSTAMALTPLCFYCIERVINREKTLRNVIYTALLLGIGILTHPLVGATLLFFFSIYVVLRVFMDRNYPHIKFVNFILWGAIAILALGLSSFYLAPIFLEKSGWHKLPESLPLANSITLRDLILRMGFPILILLILFLFKKNKAPNSWPLFIIGVFGALFALGEYGPVYKIFSFTNIYPFLGLMFATFCFAYLIAMNTPIKWEFKSKTKNFVWIQILIALIIYLAWDGFRDTYDMKLAQDQFFQTQTMEISEKLKNYDNPGRLMPMKYPFGFLLWWLTVETKTPIFEGWYYSTTLQGKHIAWLYDAINHEFPEYAIKRFEQLNIRYLLTTKNFYRHRGRQNVAFLEKLKENGFSEVENIKGPDSENASFILFLKDKPVNFLNALQEKTLVIGKHAMPVNAILEDAIQGQSIFIDEYDIDLLKRFDTIIFIGFSFQDKTKAESIIAELARSGKKVIIDMNGSNGSLLENNLNFLNVTSYREIYNSSPITLNKKKEGIKKFPDLPTRLEIPEDLNELFDDLLTESDDNPRTIPLKRWSFTSYINLDKTYVELQKEGDNPFGVIGYKEIEGGKVWFIGPNIFYHIYLTHNTDELRFIKELIANKQEIQTPAKREITIKEEILEPEKGFLKFSFDSKEMGLAMIPFTYSPHWKAYLNSKEIKIHNLEDLMILDLPAGEHTLELYYEDISVHKISRIIAITFLLILVTLFAISLFLKETNKNENSDH